MKYVCPFLTGIQQILFNGYWAQKIVDTSEIVKATLLVAYISMGGGFR